MCGIFGYINYNVSRKRGYIIQLLLDALQRLEYRGYDSAGISFDSSHLHLQCNNNGVQQYHYSLHSPFPLVFRNQGNVHNLINFIYKG